MAFVPRHCRRRPLGLSDQRLSCQVPTTIGRLHRSIHGHSVLLPDHHAPRAVAGEK